MMMMRERKVRGKCEGEGSVGEGEWKEKISWKGSGKRRGDLKMKGKLKEIEGNVETERGGRTDRRHQKQTKYP